MAVRFRIPGWPLSLNSPLVLVFLLAITVRAIYLGQFLGSPLRNWDQWDQSDMHTFLTVAGQILEGDWLVHDPYIPYHGWHRQVAPAEAWKEWHPAHTFLQVPGYVYFLAIVLKSFHGSLIAVKVVQATLGALHATLITAIGRRLMGTAGGLTAGILAAIYGPFLTVEGLVLRETLALLLSTFGVYLVMRASTWHEKGTGTGGDCPDGDWLPLCGRLSPFRRPRITIWLAAGFVLGLGALTKETGLVLFAAVLLWVCIAGIGFKKVTGAGADCPEGDRPLGRRGAGVSLLLLGFVIAFLPLIARNLAVGAPVLAPSPPAVFNFIMANAADAPASGVLFLTPRSFYAIMSEAKGRMLPAILGTVQSYGDHPGGLILRLWPKFTAIWNNIEIADNFSYEYFVMNVPVLRLLPRFACIWLPAALGMGLLLLEWNRLPAAGRFMFGLLLTVVALHAAAQMFAPVMSRYRMVIVPWLLLLAGWPVAAALESWQSKSWLSLTRLAAAALLTSVVWYLWPPHPVLPRGTVRPVDFTLGFQMLLAAHDEASARRAYEQGVAYFQNQRDQDSELLLRADRIEQYARFGLSGDLSEDWRRLRSYLPPNHRLLSYLEQKTRQPGGQQ
jgi:hypothetical protein